MRLRNVKNALETLNNSPYFVKSNNRGKWNTYFKNDNPICLEIGCGKGDFLIEMARTYPNINFIGIEKYDSVLVRAIEKIDDSITNLKLIRMDAREIDEVFDKEVDTIYLNFSDPWPKVRHTNRRLTSTNFLKKYDSLFKNDKTIIMKTDNRKLFEFSLIEFSNYGYIIEDISLDLHKDNIESNIETEYEKKFSNLGYPIYRVVVKKCKQ